MSLYSVKNLPIIKKMQELEDKWKNKPVPEKYTNEWWRYRANQIYYRSLKNKLK